MLTKTRGRYMGLITYDFVEEFVLYCLADLFQSNYKNEDIYTKHSLDNLDYFRNIQNEYLTVQEEDRFIRFIISFNEVIPKIQIIINKDNNKLCRVYVCNDLKKLGAYFDINDEQIINLVNLSSELITNITNRIKQLQIAEKENPITVHNIDTIISDKINMNCKNLLDSMDAHLYTTYYGFCLIVYYGKIMIKQTRYRFVKEEIKKDKNYDEEESVKVFINNSLEDFIKKQEEKEKRSYK